MLRQTSTILLPAALLALIVASPGTATAQRTERTAAPAGQSPSISQPAGKIPVRVSPWLVTVQHEVNIEELKRSLEQRGMKIKIADEGKGFNTITNIVSGVVMDRKGHVLTRLVNLNPEAGESGIGTIKVTLVSGETRPARFVGIDGPTGFCLLQVEGLAVEPAPFAEQPNFDAGAAVTVINPPFKTFQVASGPSQPKVTTKQGQIVTFNNLPAPRNQVIFTISFEGEVAQPYSYMGVVVDSSSNEVIGIPAASNKNIVQAFSSTEARRATDRILAKGGNVPRAWLGVGGASLASVKAENLESLAPPAGKGVLINNVYPDTPAALAGLKVGDVVLTLNGDPVESVDHLMTYIGMQPAGKTIEFGVWRDKELQKINVTLGKRGYNLPYSRDSVQAQAQKHLLEQRLSVVQNQLNLSAKTYNEFISRGEKPESEALKSLSVEMNRLSEIKKQLVSKIRLIGRQLLVYRDADKSWLGVATQDIPVEPKAVDSMKTGVRVTDVLISSAAERAGVKPNDIILRISVYPISDRESFLNVLSFLQTARPDTCELLVRRGEEKVSLRLIFKEIKKNEVTPDE
jgi:S1-C subfamily serine protease